VSSVQFHDAAEGELYDEVSFLDERAKGLGRRFLADVIRTCDAILLHPKAALEVRPGLRRRTLLRFRYFLFYSIEPDGPLILAVAHHRRRPSYWMSRVPNRG
jgi:plasmid stabilization system protein ParE